VQKGGEENFNFLSISDSITIPTHNMTGGGKKEFNQFVDPEETNRHPIPSQALTVSNISYFGAQNSTLLSDPNLYQSSAHSRYQSASNVSRIDDGHEFRTEDTLVDSTRVSDALLADDGKQSPIMKLKPRIVHYSSHPNFDVELQKIGEKGWKSLEFKPAPLKQKPPQLKQRSFLEQILTSSHDQNLNNQSIDGNEWVIIIDRREKCRLKNHLF
jgi:hypothetical protein